MVATRTLLPRLYMPAAAHMARLSAQIETKVKEGMPREKLQMEHRAYVVGSILLSVASLEGAINEIYVDALDKDSNTFKGLPPDVPQLLSQLWHECRTMSFPRRFQCALIAARKAKFQEGSTPFQEIEALRCLRNELIHYKPEWDESLRKHQKIEGLLRCRFPENPLVAKDNTFFPKRCLGHGCAEWALKSCVAFIEDFLSRMTLPPRFDINSPQLRTR